MYKVVKRSPFSKDEWKSYILWRNYNFSSFESIDSQLRKSQFEPKCDEDWEYVITAGTILTDVISDLNFAKKYCEMLNECIVIGFDYIDQIQGDKTILGYDILDGEMSYSLLTNFGNDIKIVNNVLSNNALIKTVVHASDVHVWFIKNKKDDPHVVGSKIVAVYGSV